MTLGQLLEHAYCSGEKKKVVDFSRYLRAFMSCVGSIFYRGNQGEKLKVPQPRQRLEGEGKQFWEQ